MVNLQKLWTCAVGGIYETRFTKKWNSFFSGQWKNKRLRTINFPGGHLTSSEQVDSYIQKPSIVENTKIGQLYFKVRDTRDTYLSVPWNKWYCKANVLDNRNLHLHMCATNMYFKNKMFCLNEINILYIFVALTPICSKMYIVVCLIVFNVSLPIIHV